MSLTLHTEDRLVYNYYPVTSNCINFRVKAPNDAHIILTSKQYDSIPCYEIFFGGWGNTKSVIRKNHQQPDICVVSTPNIMKAYDYQGFWIRWEYGTIMAGLQGSYTPILRYSDPQFFSIQFYGICTGWGASGDWIIDYSPAPALPPYSPQPPYAPGMAPWIGQPTSSTLYPYMGSAVATKYPKWVPAANGAIPQNALIGGKDCEGETIYVARAMHSGAILPGKLVPSHGVTYVAWGGTENGKNQYEVLCDCQPCWVPCNEGNIPLGAFPGGRTETGETLYIGKVSHRGSVTPGKVQPSHGVCYIPFGGEEVAKRIYDVLVTS